MLKFILSNINNKNNNNNNIDNIYIINSIIQHKNTKYLLDIMTLQYLLCTTKINDVINTINNQCAHEYCMCDDINYKKNILQLYSQHYINKNKNYLLDLYSDTDYYYNSATFYKIINYYNIDYNDLDNKMFDLFSKMLDINEMLKQIKKKQISNYILIKTFIKNYPILSKINNIDDNMIEYLNDINDKINFIDNNDFIERFILYYSKKNNLNRICSPINDSCYICMDDISINTEIKLLSCKNHVLDKHCYINYNKQSNFINDIIIPCPVCKNNITEYTY